MAQPTQSFSSKIKPDINKRFFALCSQVNLWHPKLFVFFVVNRFTVNDVKNPKSIGSNLSQLIFFVYFNRNVCIIDSNRLIVLIYQLKLARNNILNTFIYDKKNCKLFKVLGATNEPFVDIWYGLRGKCLARVGHVKKSYTCTLRGLQFMS
jgi:hypothetical protein